MKPSARKTISLSACILLILLSLGCPAGTAKPDEASGQLEGVPESIKAWVQNSQRIFAGQRKDEGDRTYLLVTWGEQPTGGYAVKIDSLGVEAHELVVSCKFTEPGPGQSVTQAPTYPFDLVAVPRVKAEVRFEGEGQHSHIPRVLWTSMQPIVAESRWVKVFAPAPEQTVGGSFVLKGICNTFEGTVNFVVKQGESVLHEGFATGAMGDWGYFEASVPLEGAQSGRAVLEVFTYSAKDGSIQDPIFIPLQVAL